MRLNEYLSQVEILKREIKGCSSLIDFYQNKKKQLIIEFEKFLNLEVSEVNND